MNELVNFIVGSSTDFDIEFFARCFVISLCVEFIGVVFATIGKMR